ncbi:MAG TPA: hypothetical protein VLV31_04105 [Candidatus Acidoferrales bacterium]|nr:hypothetical protein [Candidatus Acidoferrales bacterium]
MIQENHLQVDANEEELILLRKLLSTGVKVALLELFHKNPALTDDLEGLAIRLMRNVSEVEDAVKDLVDIGILKKEWNQQTFSFDQLRDAAIQEIIAKMLIQSLETQHPNFPRGDKQSVFGSELTLRSRGPQFEKAIDVSEPPVSTVSSNTEKTIEFNRIISTSVNEVITDALGDIMTGPIASYLHIYKGIMDEIPGRVDLLFASLRGLFGSGGDVLCGMIVSKIRENAGLKSLTLGGQSPLENFEVIKMEFLKT